MFSENTKRIATAITVGVIWSVFVPFPSYGDDVVIWAYIVRIITL